MGIEINRVISVALCFRLSPWLLLLVLCGGAKYGQISYDMGFLDRCESFCGSGSRRSGKCSPEQWWGAVILGLAEIHVYCFSAHVFSEYRDGIVFAIFDFSFARQTFWYYGS